MNATEVLYREYCNNLTSDTKEFNKAWDYFVQGIENSKEYDFAAEILTEATWAEGRRAFEVGVKAAVNLLTGGYDDE